MLSKTHCCFPPGQPVGSSICIHLYIHYKVITNMSPNVGKLGAYHSAIMEFHTNTRIHLHFTLEILLRRAWDSHPASEDKEGATWIRVSYSGPGTLSLSCSFSECCNKFSLWMFYSSGRKQVCGGWSVQHPAAYFISNRIGPQSLLIPKVFIHLRFCNHPLVGSQCLSSSTCLPKNTSPSAKAYKKHN